MSVKRKVSVSMVRSVGERSSARRRRIAGSSLYGIDVTTWADCRHVCHEQHSKVTYEAILEVPNGVGSVPRSPGDERDDDVGGVSVEVLASPVVDDGGPGISVAGGDLDVAKRDAGVKGGHDEGGSEHVGVYQAEPGPLADGADSSMSGTPVGGWSEGHAISNRAWRAPFRRAPRPSCPCAGPVLGVTPATRESKVQTGSVRRASSAFDRTDAPGWLSARSIQVLPVVPLVASDWFSVKPTRAGQPGVGGGPNLPSDLASSPRRRLHSSTECSNASASSGNSILTSPVSRSTHPTFFPSTASP